MAEKRVYIGSFNNDNKKILHDKIINYLNQNKGDKFYYILPNGNLLKKYRRDFINKVGATLELNLYTFDDIVNNIVLGDSNKSIEEPLKGLIIRNIIKNLSDKNQIEYYKEVSNMEGFVNTCINIIREIKRSLVTPDIYLSKCPDEGYYREIGIIYKEYEEFLMDKSLSDRENDYLNSIKILNQNPDYLSDLEFIIIDEFYDFRPIESEIIKELSKKDIDIYINIPFGSSLDNLILKDTVRKLEGFGFIIEYLDKEPSNVFEALSNKLFTYDDEKLDFIKDLEVVKSPSFYIEMKKIFRDIKKKIYDGINLDDIAVVVTSNSYLNTLFKVANEEGIPLIISKKTSLLMLPIVKELINIIKTRLSDGLKEDILNRIKSSYFPICDSYDKDEVEYYIRKLNFNSLDDLYKIIEKNHDIDIPVRYIGIIKELVEKIRDENDLISEENAVNNYNSIFINLIDLYKIEDRIFNIYKSLRDYDIFYRDLMALEKLKKVLHQMNEIAYINDRMTFEDYYLVLKDYLKEENIIETDENIKGLKVLNPINSRGLSHKILYVVGLSQEEYPQLNNKSFFLSDDNYYTLKKIGIDVLNYHERFANEALKFSTIISSCKEQLYLSFNENSQEEGKNIPSMFLDELLSKIKGDKIEDKVKYSVLELDYLISSNIDEITCEKDLVNALLYKYYTEELDEKYLSILESRYGEQIDRINKIIDIERMRASGNYNQFNGLLHDESIKSYINTDLDNKVFSISYLEGYSMCPYYFLLHNYFKVEEMGRTTEDFSPIDIGTIYHEVLNHYYRKYQKDLINNIAGFKFEDTTEYLRSLVNKYAAMANYDIGSKKDYLVVDNIYLRLENFIKDDINRIKKYNILPWEFEVEFGVQQPFVIETNNEKISFRGKIDRIDKLVESEGYIVIDYKSSSYGKKDLSQIETGLSLQLPVYILSQDHRNVVAGAYSILSNGDFSTAMGILGEAGFITKRQKGALDKEQWNSTLENTKNTILKIVQNIKDGNFSVNPLDCSDYCPYKDICRYEKVMEVS